MIDNRNVMAFLQVIRACEGTFGRDGYRTMFGGALFDSYADHPRKKIPYGSTYTTAAGAYQFLESTWDDCRAHLNLPDFSPDSQNRAAVYLIQRRSALEDVMAGRLEEAIYKCNKEWASLPGSPYGQPTKPMSYCVQVYTDNGGVVDGSTVSREPRPEAPDAHFPQPNEARMGATLLASLLPTVLGMFSGRAQAAISQATGADPATAAAFTKDLFAKVGEAVGVPVTDDASAIKAAAKLAESPPAVVKDVEDHALFALVESGGGIPAAREADRAAEGTFWKSPAIWVVLVVFVPPIDYTIYRLVSQMGEPSTELITQTVTAILGLLAVISAFYLGSSVGSQRKDDALVRKL